MTDTAPPSVRHAELIADLPGAELVARGLDDLAEGIESIESLVVSIATRRLRAAGLDVARLPDLDEYAETRLYTRLQQDPELQGHPGDPYRRYNALKRELTSFAAALDHRVWSSRRRQVFDAP